MYNCLFLVGLVFGVNSSEMMRCWCCTLVITFVVCQLAQLGDAQAYHFSKGWMPGRKRGDPGLAGATTRGSLYGEQDRRMCAVRSQTYQFAIDILKVVRRFS